MAGLMHQTDSLENPRSGGDLPAERSLATLLYLDGDHGDDATGLLDLMLWTRRLTWTLG